MDISVYRKISVKRAYQGFLTAEHQRLDRLHLVTVSILVLMVMGVLTAGLATRTLWQSTEKRELPQEMRK
jgi:hypothetical protein